MGQRNRVGSRTLSVAEMFLALSWLTFIGSGCSTPSHVKYYYPYSFNETQALAVKKVVVAPPNLVSPVPPFLAGKEGLLYNKVIAYLNEHGVVAEPAEAAGWAWHQEKKQIGGVYDSENGKVDKEKFIRSVRNMVSQLCRQLSADAVVLPDIIIRSARMDGTRIYWDGTDQPIAMKKDAALTFTGQDKALSLGIMIYGKDGRLILRNVGGLEHPGIATVSGGRRNTTVAFKLRDNLLSDGAKIDQAIALGLHPFIPFAEYPKEPVFSKE